MYQLKAAIPYDFQLVSHMDERRCAQNHFKTLRPGDLVVFDRGYFSYLMLKDVLDQSLHAVFRLKSNTGYVAIKEFWESERNDQIVTIYPPKSLIKKLKKQKAATTAYDPITIRLIKYTIASTTYVLATTLVDQNRPRQVDFPDLYHSRWGIEELYKVSKIHIDVEDFHGQSESTVKQEIYAHFVLITLARLFEQDAELAQSSKDQYEDVRSIHNPPCNLQVPPKPIPELLNAKEAEQVIHSLTQEEKPPEKMKINFKNCILVVSRAIENLFLVDSVQFVRKKIPQILKSIARLRQKVRPGRHYPRISKKPLKRRRDQKNKESVIPTPVTT